MNDIYCYTSSDNPSRLMIPVWEDNLITENWNTFELNFLMEMTNPLKWTGSENYPSIDAWI